MVEASVRRKYGGVNLAVEAIAVALMSRKLFGF
jgi:hypothetical protein